MTAVVVAVFGLTYVLIAARRLRALPIGRPAGALLGAFLMVAIGALRPADSYAAIDGDTILLLFAMMALVAYVERAGFFEWAAARAIARARTPVGLLVAVAVLAGAMSALFVNDAVCVFLTPLVVVACQKARLPLGPYLIATATSANLGSAATLVGNPQNMIVGGLSGLSFTAFSVLAAPVAALALAINTGLLLLYYRRALGDAPLADVPSASFDRGRLTRVVAVVLGVVVAFFAGAHLGYAALGGVVALFLGEREDPHAVFARVDWTLLVFFAALFVVVAGLETTGLVDAAWATLGPSLGHDGPAGVSALTLLYLVGSNLVSNVPMVLLAAPHVAADGSTFAWVLLGFVTTVAGNLTLIGSVANIIVAEKAADAHELGFFEYLRFGLVSTLVVLAVCVPALVVLARALGT
ncbi:SLC13 family permease [Nannocystis bainbridge]|uniref:SLC13 family permease n=1 Tax=Nannocystis bainbridge TaxID=2995303 RepID=A0ABT5DQX5_9BACT|nr:SLC13 family permease [Nannocystis bainbridge]MDC0715999.1 SLC13 family permease [Nannocystis bainbridge]